MKINTINVSDLTYIIKTTPSDQNIMLIGKHGIGKSEILTSIYSKEREMMVIPLFLGQMSDPGDIIGLPHKNEDTGRTEFLPPYWFPIDGKPIVLFLDELNRARPEILQAVQDLALNKTIAGRKLPNGSVIISAINAGDEYTVTDIDPALLSRFNVYNFCPTVEEWLRWAVNHGVSQYVIDFISSHADLLDSKYTAGTDSTEKSYDRRSWERVSSYIINNPIELTEAKNRESWKRAICGMVGDIAGSSFCAYLKDANCVTPEMVLFDFDKNVGYLNNLDTLSLMQMTVRICLYIEQYDPVHKTTAEKERIAESLKRYVNFLYSEVKTTTRNTASRENAQYFVGEIETGLYPKLMAFINMTPDVDELVTKIISESEC